jgi:hypothetical protein
MLTLTLQVVGIGSAVARAVATDSAVLRRLLQQCLPADLLASLGIDALVDAMIKSTVVQGEVGGPGAPKTPPSASAQEATVKVTQIIPGVSASEVRGCTPRAREGQGDPTLPL